MESNLEQTNTQQTQIVHCPEKKRKLCGRMECITCYQKSYFKIEQERPNFSLKWDYNNNGDLHPLQIHKNTWKEYNFHCSFCGDSVLMPVKYMTQGLDHGEILGGGFCGHGFVFSVNQ